MSKPISFETLCVSEIQDHKTTKPHQLPLYATSSFTFDSIEDAIDIFTGKTQGHVYGRYGNPTIDTVASKLSQLEGFGSSLDCYAFLTSSGMSAISTLMYGLLNAGDRILTQGNLYGGTTELFLKILSRHQINATLIDFSDLNLVEDYLKTIKDIKLIYIETPANPTMSCVDLSALADLAKKYNVISVIDNTFCTPYLQQPLKHGIDFVIHSTTKYLNGHGNSIAGAIIGHKQELKKDIFVALKLIGSTCNPWDAWLLNNGLKTLILRMDKHSTNAMAIATSLTKNAKVNLVNYNGLPNHPSHMIASKQMSQYGGMLSFEVAGGQSQALKVINKMKIATNAPTLGDVDTLVLHPASSSHLNVDKAIREANGISDGLIRLSVGIESIQDLIEDLDQAIG
jgi:methionine-gamma-lyase